MVLSIAHSIDVVAGFVSVEGVAGVYDGCC